MQDRQRERQERADDEEIESAFRLAALYITLAFALQPKRDVYKRSLKVSTATNRLHALVWQLLGTTYIVLMTSSVQVVRPLLPGGALCAGPLQAVVPLTAHSSSERCSHVPTFVRIGLRHSLVTALCFLLLRRIFVPGGRPGTLCWITMASGIQLTAKHHQAVHQTRAGTLQGVPERLASLCWPLSCSWLVWKV